MRYAHRRHGSDGQAFGPGVRKEAHGARRLGLRDLRRIFLQRQRARRRRGRRYGDGGSDVSHKIRIEGVGRAPPRPTARVENHAGPRREKSQDRVCLEYGGRGHLRRPESRRRYRSSIQQCKDRQKRRFQNRRRFHRHRS